jgi:hypothetical protein
LQLARILKTFCIKRRLQNARKIEEKIIHLRGWPDSKKQRDLKSTGINRGELPLASLGSIPD